MRLVEVVRGELTSPETADAGIAVVRAMGRTPVVVAECPGFLVNRVLVRAMASSGRARRRARWTTPPASRRTTYYSEAVDEARRCLAEGVAGPDDIDLALRLGAGWSEGPLTGSGGA